MVGRKIGGDSGRLNEERKVFSAATRQSLARSLATTIVALCAFPAVVGQQMSFSVYEDLWLPDSPDIGGYSNVIDNSWGCSHGNYYTTVRLISPSGRMASSSSPGLSASTSLGINEEEGGWSIVTTGSYNCSCVYGGSTGFGASQNFDVFLSFHKTYYTNVVWVPHGCDYYAHNCFGDSTPTCGVSLPQHVIQAPPCAPTTRINFMKVKAVMFNTVWEKCLPGISFPGAGTGLCNGWLE